jgi:hypothetical protein
MSELTPIPAHQPPALRTSAPCQGTAWSAGQRKPDRTRQAFRRRRHQIPAMWFHLAGHEHEGMEPACDSYLIRINGHLGATLLGAFPAMAWQRRGQETVLTGALDRPALYGVLAEIEALGLDLLEVRQLTPEPESPECGETCSP